MPPLPGTPWIGILVFVWGNPLTVALPGVPPERIELHLDDGRLAISAVRPPPQCAHNAIIRRLEIPYGRFERLIALPPGRYELLEQLPQNGCLQLRLRKS